jgi:hypothetical protein
MIGALFLIVFVHGREGGGEKRQRRGGIERAYLFIRH